MRDLIQFNWRAFNATATYKVALGVIIMMLLTSLTGESWLATGLVALFVWLTNVPGPLRSRTIGMLTFAAGAIVITLVSGLMGLLLWPNIIAIAVIGFLGTLALARGTRAFMVGFALICWGIYGPFLVESTSVSN